VVVVSTFTDADVEVAYRIFTKGRVSPWSLSAFEKSAMNGISLLAKEKNIVIGHIILTSVLDELTVEDITVDSVYRRQGTGRKLMQAAFESANKMQQSAVYLEVRCSNQAAIKLYSSMDFDIVGERKNYYDTTETSVTLSNPEYGVISKQAPKQSASRENAYVMKKVL
jgi:ribosomal-protein-alanine N-acetyltransferase